MQVTFTLTSGSGSIVVGALRKPLDFFWKEMMTIVILNVRSSGFLTSGWAKLVLKIRGSLSPRLEGLMDALGGEVW